MTKQIQHAPPSPWLVDGREHEIGVIGLTGEYKSGKTLFAGGIDPAHTIFFDNEGSASFYANQMRELYPGFEYFDVYSEVASKMPANVVVRPIDRFNWWYQKIHELPAYKFTVAVVDPISEFEDGIDQYIRENCEMFRLTAEQVDKASGLYWGVLKSYYKSLIELLRSKVYTFVFTTHMRYKYVGNRPTPAREPKGKETLAEMVTLYLQLERRVSEKGVIPEVPAAVVLHSRLGFVKKKGMSPEFESVLPDRLPRATPDAIRGYLAKPADRTRPRAGETLAEEKLSDDDRLVLARETEEFKAEAAKAELARFELMSHAQNAGEGTQKSESACASDSALAPASPAETTGHDTVPTDRPAAKKPAESPKAEPSPPDSDRPKAAPPAPFTSDADRDLATRQQVSALAALVGELEMPNDRWQAALAKRGVSITAELTRAQAAELIAKLEETQRKRWADRALAKN